LFPRVSDPDLLERPSSATEGVIPSMAKKAAKKKATKKAAKKSTKKAAKKKK
jgi:hypothetical protein